MYKHHRFPPDIIQYTVWVYFRFNHGRINTVWALRPFPRLAGVTRIRN